MSALAIGGQAVCQSDTRRDFVVSGQTAYLVFPPEFVCGPEVRQTIWSPDGKKLAAIRVEPPLKPTLGLDLSDQKALDAELSKADPEQQIVVWSAVTGKSTTWLRVKQSEGRLLQCWWLAGSSSVLVQALPSGAGPAVATEAALYLVTANGQTKQVAVGSLQELDVDPSPSRPIVALIRRPPMPAAKPGETPAPPTQTLRLFGTDGVLSDPIELGSRYCMPFWSKDGQLYMETFERQPKPQPVKRIWFVVNLKAGRLDPASPPADRPDLARPPSPAELTIENWTAQISRNKIGVNAPTIVITPPAAKPDEFSILTTDGTEGELSPKNNAVSYRYQGSLVVRAMVKTPLEAFLRAKLDAQRAVLISNARQVALAMLMYANDNNDNLIGSGSNWRSAISSYLGDASLMSGFQMVYAGGSMDSIESPADTELGYFDGPGGRAVAYSDGHVKWIPY